MSFSLSSRRSLESANNPLRSLSSHSSSLHTGKVSVSGGKEEGDGIGLNGRRGAGSEEIGLDDTSRRRIRRKKKEEAEGEEGY